MPPPGSGGSRPGWGASAPSLFVQPPPSVLPPTTYSSPPLGARGPGPPECFGYNCHWMAGDIMFTNGAFIVTKLVNTITIFWKKINQFLRKFAQVVPWIKALNNQLCGSRNQRSRSHEAKMGHKYSFRRYISRTIKPILTKPAICVTTT